MKRSTRLATYLAALILPLTAAAMPATAVTASTASQVLLGVFPGVGERDAFNRWSHKQPAVELMFTDWTEDNLDHTFEYLTFIWGQGEVPEMTWEIFTQDGYSGPRVNSQIAGGTYDAYIDMFTTRLHAWLAGPDGIYGNLDDRRIYIRLGHEMNGDWYPWSPGYKYSKDAPSDYMAMWRHVHDKVAAQTDASHVQWMWVVMNCACSRDMEDLYPGDDYVDWVGIDAYNWGPYQKSGWQTPEQMMKPWLDRVSRIAPQKPIVIGEIATVSDGVDKNQWLRDMAGFISGYESPSGRRIRLASYFNATKSEKVAGGTSATIAWSVFDVQKQVGMSPWSDVKQPRKSLYGFDAYRDTVGTWTNFIGHDAGSGNKRLLTNRQFQGTD